MVNKFKNSALIFHLNCVSVADYFLAAVPLIAGDNTKLKALVNTSVVNKLAVALI